MATPPKPAAKRSGSKSKTATKAKVTARRITTKKKAAAKKKTPAKKKAPAKRFGPRRDLGAPIDAFFAKQPSNTRPILEALRALVEEVVPEAESSLKWGMPFYTLKGKMMCALGGHKSHVNLVLSGPPGAFSDPDGLLTGAGKTGRHLKLTRLEALPTPAVKGWLRTAAQLALGQ